MDSMSDDLSLLGELEGSVIRNGKRMLLRDQSVWGSDSTNIY